MLIIELLLFLSHILDNVKYLNSKILLSLFTLCFFKYFVKYIMEKLLSKLLSKWHKLQPEDVILYQLPIFDNIHFQLRDWTQSSSPTTLEILSINIILFLAIYRDQTISPNNYRLSLLFFTPHKDTLCCSKCTTGSTWVTIDTPIHW